jgi:uncharacterized protein (DUF1786 family)
VPSPTMMVHHRIKEATRRKQPVLLTGVTMGGGPSQWAAEAHARAGLPIFATPEAAQTFNDELELVEAMGIRVIAEDEAAALQSRVLQIDLCDFDYQAIRRALAEFGVSLDDLTAIAVAVFDHGNAPPGVSDRQFRFDYLDQKLREANRPGEGDAKRRPLASFAFLAENIPPSMTRLQAVAQSARRSGIGDLPLVVMDTAPAAVLGATFDPRVSSRQRVMIANIGNFHTLAFRLGPGGVEGVFEHHTGLLDLPQLEELLTALAQGTLTHQDVFAHHGHGALVYEPRPLVLADGDFDVAITGPRRSLFSAQPHLTRLRPYLAVPYGDMMIAGCFGLLASTAVVLPECFPTIMASFEGGAGTAPWDG